MSSEKYNNSKYNVISKHGKRWILLKECVFGNCTGNIKNRFNNMCVRKLFIDNYVQGRIIDVKQDIWEEDDNIKMYKNINLISMKMIADDINILFIDGSYAGLHDIIENLQNDVYMNDDKYKDMVNNILMTCLHEFCMNNIAHAEIYDNVSYQTIFKMLKDYLMMIGYENYIDINLTPYSFKIKNGINLYHCFKGYFVANYDKYNDCDNKQNCFELTRIRL